MSLVAAVPFISNKIELEVASFDLNSEIALMQSYASASYCNLNKYWRFSACLKTPETQLVAHLPDAGYIAYNSKLSSIIIMFSGSSEFEDFIQDVMKELVPLDNYPSEFLVHKGFQVSYRNIGNQVLKSVALLIGSYPTTTIRIVGHSLGGALSSLAALHIAHAFPQIIDSITVFTFGQPRIGNRHVAEKINLLFKDRYYRVTHEADIGIIRKTSNVTLNWARDVVTFFPTNNEDKVWYHCGREYWLSDNTLFECSSNAEEDLNCSAGLRNYTNTENLLELLILPTLYQDIQDHALNSYFYDFGDYC
ncbi:hypothetical protein HDU92_006412 [Lobulomyces angularis]|nr:hypothetical protein HDU92_006412 [Lobulomyces angularis]